LRSAAIAGSATLTEDMFKGIRKVATQMLISVSQRTDADA
jgi:hypothetical protein